MRFWRRERQAPESSRARKPFCSLQIEQLESRLVPTITGSIQDIPLTITNILDGSGTNSGSSWTVAGNGTATSSYNVPPVGTSDGTLSFSSSVPLSSGSTLSGSFTYSWNLNATSETYLDPFNQPHFYLNSTQADSQSAAASRNPIYRFHVDVKTRFAYDMSNPPSFPDDLTSAAMHLYLKNDAVSQFYQGLDSPGANAVDLDPGDYSIYPWFTGYADSSLDGSAQTSGSSTVTWGLSEITSTDLVATSIGFDGAKKGIDFSYAVVGPKMSAATTVQLYWASGPNLVDKLAPAGLGQLVASGTANVTRNGFVAASTMGMPPAGTQYLLFVVDPTNKINEFDEGNNVQALKLDAAAILTNSVEVVASGATIKATFKPAGGALTVPQAEALLGVDHFNWINTIQTIPSHWNFYQFDPVRNAAGVLQNSYPPNIPGTQLAPGNIVDPVQSTTQIYGFSTQNDPNRFSFVLPQYLYDNQPFYYNEAAVSPNPYKRIQFDTIQKHTTGTSVDFFDAPFVHAGDINGPNEGWTFVTKLVGVKEDKSYTAYTGFNTCFTWGSNAVVDDGYKVTAGGVSSSANVTYFAVAGRTLTAPILAGGINLAAFGAAPLNHVPVLDPVPDRVVEKREVIAFTAHATDIDPGDTVTYTLTEAPKGATIDPATGEFSWIPGTTTAPGTYHITITATDNGVLRLGGRVRFTVNLLGSTAQQGQATLLRNIRTGALSSRQELAAGTTVAIAGNYLFFMANDGLHGNEVWRTNGTAAGTVLLKDISPGAKNTLINEMIGVNNTLYFTTGNTPQTSSIGDLWRSDGTTAGTVRLVTPGSGSGPYSLTAVGNSLFYTVRLNGGTVTQLWKVDNGSNTPVLLAQFNDPVEFGSPSAVHDLIAANGTLFFRVIDQTDSTKEGLWKSDGTPAGTILLQTFDRTGPGLTGAAIYSMTNVNGVLYFMANTISGGTPNEALWKSDGTAPGTVQVADLPDQFTYQSLTYRTQLVAVNGTLFLIVPNSDFELWTSDGTGPGTTFVKQITPTLNYHVGYATDVNGTLYFLVGPLNEPLTQLWKSDGTAGGTSLVSDLPGFNGSGDGNTLLHDAASIYFSKGFDLWRIDTASARIFQAASYAPPVNNPQATGPSHLTWLNGKIFFTSYHPSYGVEPWVYDPTKLFAFTPVRFVDTDGDVYSVSLSGPGRATVSIDDSDGNRRGPIDYIILQGTDALKSTLRITVTPGLFGNGRTSVKSITGTGLLNLFAGGVDVVGTGIDLSGRLGYLIVRDILNGADVSAVGAVTQVSKIAARIIGDGTVLDVGSALVSLTALKIGDAQINAPRIGTLTVRGDFLADLTISGSGITSGTAALGTVTIAGAVSNANISVNGSVTSFKAGAFINSRLYLGFVPTNSADPMAGGTFTLGFSIGSFTTTRKTVPSFDNSVVAADSIGTVLLSSIDANNAGLAYGILGHFNILSVTVTTPAFVLDVTNLSDQGVGDFKAQYR